VYQVEEVDDINCKTFI